MAGPARDDDARTARPGRRALVRGAAWAAPTIVVSTAAPALAASEKGLQGWVQVGKYCPGGFNGNILTIDGTGNYPDRGLWVYNVPVGKTPTAARVTLYYPTGLVSTFTNNGASTWTLATSFTGATPISGFTAFTFLYSGAWTRRPDNTMVANDDPDFTANISHDACLASISIHAERSVTVDGETITFHRGPVTLTTSQGRRSGSAQGSSDGARSAEAQSSDGGGAAPATTPESEEAGSTVTARAKI